MTYRTRSRGTIISGTATTSSFYHNAATTTTTHAGQPSGKSEIMTDFVTDSFERKRNEGLIVNSPMEKLTIEAAGNDLKTSHWVWDIKPSYTWTTGSAKGFSSPDVIGLRVGALAPPTSKLPVWNETLAGLALASARANAAKPEAQLLVTLGEARETLNMLDDALQLLTRRVMPFQALQRQYYRGQLSYRDFLDAMSSAWLTYRYGVMPLIYDVQGYINALTKDRKPVRNTARGGETDSGSSTWSQTLLSDMIATISLDWQLNWEVSYRATVLYEFTDDLQARLGLRLADVPTAALELVRLSFVADWFINASDFLGSLTLAARGDVLLQCVTETLTASAVATYRESGTKSNTYYTSRMVSDGSGSKVSFAFTRKARKPYSELAPGTLSPRVNLTWKRIVDGLALLATTMDITDRKRRSVRI